GSEEVPTAVPAGLGATRAGQSHKGLVNERRRLERLARRLLSQPLRRHAAQLVVDQRPEIGRRLGVAFVDGGQQGRDFIHQPSLKDRSLYCRTALVSRIIDVTRVELVDTPGPTESRTQSRIVPTA